ncbi:MAG: hypothetical protein HZC26_01075 [Candidatus Magasanikbacteria bacterium]|nr:hypothetical protein [Candidatus Magasanikbacteria bacterium]
MIETEHFYLFPPLGAFIESYLMIASKSHYANLSVLPMPWIKELRTLEQTARRFLLDTYKLPVIEYEHGTDPTSNEKAGGCVEHFHLALIATKKDVFPTITTQLGCGKHIKNIDDLTTLYRTEQLSAYLLYKDKKHVIYWNRPLIISQYMRRLLAPDLEKQKFDWHFFPFKKNMERCKKKWKAWFKDQTE